MIVFPLPLILATDDELETQFEISGKHSGFAVLCRIQLDTIPRLVDTSSSNNDLTTSFFHEVK